MADLAKVFREVRTRIVLKLLPSSLVDIRSAVLRELSAMLLRIEPTLGGVPLTIKKIKVEGSSAALFEDQPHVHLNVVASFLVFAPETGKTIAGVVNNVADDTIGLLILDTFNAVIPKDELPEGFSFNYANSSWSNRKTGQEITNGSELLFRCKDMRTTDQGLIQVLATFVGMANEEAPRPKKSKKSSLTDTAGSEVKQASADRPTSSKSPAKAPQDTSALEASTPASKDGKRKKHAEAEVAATSAASDSSAKRKKSKTKAGGSP